MRIWNLKLCRVNIARDIVLLGIEISSSAHIGVPVGFDVKITAVEEGKFIVITFKKMFELSHSLPKIL